MNFSSDFLQDKEINAKLQELNVLVTSCDSMPPSFSIQISPQQLGELLDWASDKATSFCLIR